MTTADTPPPADIDAERAVIGACLTTPRALDSCAEIVTVDDFYRPAHADLFAAMLAMREAGREVDPLTVADHLGDQIVRLGGAPYLLDCTAAVPTAANAAYYAEIVADAATRRRLSDAALRINQLAHHGLGPGIEVADLVERSRATLDAVAAGARGDVETIGLADLVDDALDRYESPQPPSLSTGWAALDDALAGGLRPGTLTIIGARPNVGKTILGANLATNAASAGHGVILFSLEMPRAELTDRIIASVADVRLHNITTRTLSPVDWSRVRTAATRLRSWPLHINDHPNLGLTGIRSLARDRLRTARGLGLIVIDYVGLIRPADPRVPRQEQVAAFSRGLKLLAKELDVPVVALAQVNREAARSETQRPQLHQLRESGAIEADADAVWLLHRPTELARAGEIDVGIAKNRHAALTTVTLLWEPHHARARDFGTHHLAVV